MSQGDWGNDGVKLDRYSENEEIKKNVDGRLAMIQEEDQGKDFSDLMRNAEDIQKNTQLKKLSSSEIENDNSIQENGSVAVEPVYKVFIGSYTSAEQAKVAKDIIVESGLNLNPIVKCIGSNNYTLQVGLFKQKTSAEALLYSIQQSHLPGRIVQDF